MAFTGYTIGDKIRMGYDSATNEYGMQAKIKNKTGSSSVKGTLVTPNTVDEAFELVGADGPDPCWVVYEAGVSDGQDAWCWLVGSTCQVLLEDSTAATSGYWAKVSDNDAGRVDASNAAPPGGTIAALEDHLSEVGHALEDVTAGTDELCLITFHTN